MSTSASAAGGDLDLTIVIVVYRTPEFLRRCLDSIDSADLGLRYEVLIYDNNPPDDASARVAAGRPRVTYRANAKNLGFGRAVNQGLGEGRGRAFLILNPDVEVTRGSVESLLRLLDREEDVGIACPRLHYKDGTLQHSVRTFYTAPVFLLRRTFLGRLFPNARVLREHLMLDWDHESTRDVDWCLGGGMMVRRRAVEDVGPMDERFFLYFEDVDWCYRMQQRGWRVTYHPESRMVHHYQRASAGILPKRGLFIHLASLVRFYEKWSFLLYWLKLRSAALRRVALVLTDLVAVVAAFVLAYALRGWAGGLLTKPLFAFEKYYRFLAFTTGTAGAFFILTGLYRERLRPSFLDNLMPVTRALLWTSVLMMASTFLFSVKVYSRVVVLLFFPLAVFLTTLLRTLLLLAVESFRKHDLNTRRIGILGPEELARPLGERLTGPNRLGLEAVPLHLPEGLTPAEGAARLRRRARQERLQELVLFEDGCPDLATYLAEMRLEELTLRVVPRIGALLPPGATLLHYFGSPAITIGGRGARLRRSVQQRVLDVVTATALAVFLLLPFLIVAAKRRAGGRRVTETLELRGGGGRTFRVSRLADLSSGDGWWMWLLGHLPALPRMFGGELALVGIYPFRAVEWAALDAGARATPADAWCGCIGPWCARPMDAQELFNWNRAYAETWSEAEDFRILGCALGGPDSRGSGGR